MLRPFNWERTATNSTEKTGYPLTHTKKMSSTLSKYHIQKLTQNGSKTLDIRSKVIKLLGMKTEQKLYNTGFGNDFLRYDAKGIGNEKITNWT